MQRPAFIEQSSKSPVKKAQSFSMNTLDEADRNAYKNSILDDPNTWKAHIRNFDSMIQVIYRRTGMRGISANQLNEIEQLEDNIRECLQILRTLE